MVTADQLLPGGFEYERFRHFMTDETLAAVRAAKEAGAGDIVVSDSPGNGENLLIEEFPKDVRIVRAWPRHGGMMAGLDSSFSAAIFLGYHASTTNPAGVRAHTFSSAHYARVALNGNAVTEGEFNAASAGAKGVPVVFASGDDAAVAEIKSRLGSIETVETKKSLSFHSAETLTPAASCDRIFAGVKSASGRLRDSNLTLLRRRLRWKLRSRITCPRKCSVICELCSGWIHIRSGLWGRTWTKLRTSRNSYRATAPIWLPERACLPIHFARPAGAARHCSARLPRRRDQIPPCDRQFSPCDPERRRWGRI